MAEDYYETLGVSKSASRDEIKKAYKKLAKKYHPDNKDSGDADRFKKINEAAAVLGDDKKRQHYDQFGTADTSGFGRGGARSGGFDSSSFSGFGNDFDDIFDHLGDMFGGDFGSAFGSRRGRKRQRRGEDLRYDIDITLEEAAFGVTKNISYTRLGPCSKCEGSGAEPGSGVSTCPTCHGSGRVTRAQRTPFGMFQTTTVCPKCGGEGTHIEQECSNCDGTGLVRESKNVDVKIPPGIDDDMRLRLEGHGNLAPNQGVAGDLFIFVHVKPHDKFVRDGDNIHIDYPISVSQAALGTTIEVPTLTGSAKLKIPSGTQPETVFRMKGKGIQNLNYGNTGDQMVKIDIRVPEKLNKNQKKLYEELAKEDKKTGFFKKLFG